LVSAGSVVVPWEEGNEFPGPINGKEHLQQPHQPFKKNFVLCSYARNDESVLSDKGLSTDC
jgi:hypothetical protein